MILLIDNYDSFSYNLYQLVGEINSDIKVARNDELTLSQVEDMAPTHIIISPGPGRPENAGLSEKIIDNMKDKAKILGVCLGHQAICHVFGGNITYAKRLCHGKEDKITLTDKDGLFKNIDDVITVARYHSLVAEKDSLPSSLKITALSSDREIMAVEHKEYSISGVQFHPESIMTPQGKQIIKNFLEA